MVETSAVQTAGGEYSSINRRTNVTFMMVLMDCERWTALNFTFPLLLKNLAYKCNGILEMLDYFCWDRLVRFLLCVASAVLVCTSFLQVLHINIH